MGDSKFRPRSLDTIHQAAGTTGFGSSNCFKFSKGNPIIPSAHFKRGPVQEHASSPGVGSICHSVQVSASSVENAISCLVGKIPSVTGSKNGCPGRLLSNQVAIKNSLPG